MLKTYKYKLYKAKKTRNLDRLINIGCDIYNHCIALHKRYYKLFGEHLHIYKIQKHITKMKKIPKYSYWNKLGSQAIQQITERIDDAYKRFFKKQSNRPTFKKKINYKSFTLKGVVGYKLDGCSIVINKYKYRFSANQVILPEDKIKTVTIKRDNLGDFYLCISLETSMSNHITTGKSVGMDFGLKTFLTLSDGIKIESPEFYKHSLKLLKQKSKQLSSKQKDSNNRKRARLVLARCHKKITNQRRDWFFKLANKFASLYDVIFIEDLNLQGMSKRWGRKMSDIAFSEFINILSTKTHVAKIDKFYPSSKTCSKCGHIKKDLTLNDRTYICQKCGLEIDRDYNASLNIYKVGASTFGGELEHFQK